MKKLKKIELPKMNLHPEHRLSYDEMARLGGGGGCICLKTRFFMGGVCTCDNNPFGLCKEVKCNNDQCVNNFGSYGELSSENFY
mgnify:CR=1 FL=1